MKKSITLSLFLFATAIQAQTFETVAIPGLTTITSNSRSANFIDINADGFDDIFISNSASPGLGENNMLYINNTDGTFTAITNDHITLDDSRSVAASFADADNDGDLDAYMVTWGSNTKNYFYRNNGNGTFTYEPTNVSGSLNTFSEMATWIDANNDQNLDIYFTNSSGSAANRYYENQVDGTFSSNTNIEFTNEVFGTRSVDLIDYDNDGDSDLFLTNENNAKNSLYRNDGVNSYIKITDLSIVSDFKNSGGSSWADIDNDGDFDLFVANYSNSGQSNQLFINSGGTFTEQTTSVIASAESNSFGSTFGDLDNDGDLDLIVCNSYLASIENNYIYINDGNGNFTQDSTSELAQFTGNTYSAALGDYDNNGWLDVIYANNQNEGQANTLYRNTGSGNNWVKFNCVGVDSNTSAIGAKIRVMANINGNNVWQTRKITANSGYCSQNSYAVHFGLGNATVIDQLEITWPIGTVETFTNINPNDFYTVIENAGLSVDENKQFLDSMFPNPVNDSLNIQLGSTMMNRTVKIAIMDINGNLLSQTQMTPTSTAPLNINISQLASGPYLIGITEKKNNKLLVVKKIIKK